MKQTYLKIVYFKWHSEIRGYIQIFQLWSLRLHGDCLHKVRLLGQWSQSWFYWSGITQNTGWLLEACNPWRHHHQRREAFLHKKQIKGPLVCHGTFAEFESITSRERSETSQGSLHSQLGDRYTLQGIFHASILTVLYSSLSWASDRKKTEKEKPSNATMVI